MNDYMTELEVSALLRMHPGTLRNWRWLGRGPAWHKVEGKVLYARAELARYMAEARR